LAPPRGGRSALSLSAEEYGKKDTCVGGSGADTLNFAAGETDVFLDLFTSEQDQILLLHP
jgi:hypothetical protein